jgi:hypothetical protein
MFNWTDYGKELVLLSVDTFVLACAWKWYRNVSRATDALEVIKKIKKEFLVIIFVIT